MSFLPVLGNVRYELKTTLTVVNLIHAYICKQISLILLLIFCQVNCILTLL